MASPTAQPLSGESALPLRFILLTFAFTWVFWLPATLVELGVVSIPVPSGLLVVPGTFGPMLAALALTVAEEGGSGVRALLARVIKWRVAPIWWAVAALGPLLATLSGIGLHAVLGGELPSSIGLVESLPTVVVMAVYMVLFVALGEEVGWRGYALPALQSRYSAFWSSAILGLIWALWHLPLFFNPAMSYSRLPFPVFLAYMIPFAMIITWVYNSTRGSLLLVIVLHAMVNASTDLWTAAPDLARLGVASPAEATLRANLLMAIVAALLAIAVVIATGPRDLSHQPRQIRELDGGTEG